MNPPFDTAEHIFLGRAVLRVGRVMFGPGWQPCVDAEGAPTEHLLSVWHAIAGAPGTAGVGFFSPKQGFRHIAQARVVDPIRWEEWMFDNYRVELGRGLPVPTRWIWLFVERARIEALEIRLGNSAAATEIADERPYTDWDRLLWAARRLREIDGTRFKGISERGLARAFADAEGGSGKSREARERDIGRIRKAIGRLDDRDRERLSTASLEEND